MWKWLHRLTLFAPLVLILMVVVPAIITPGSARGYKLRYGKQRLYFGHDVIKVRLIRLQKSPVPNYRWPVPLWSFSKFGVSGDAWLSSEKYDAGDFGEDAVIISRYPNFHLLVKRYSLSISSWYLFSLLVIYPTIFFIRTYRRRRVNRQALQPCGQCGYDLQGNESGTCPECGAANTIPSKTEITS